MDPLVLKKLNVARAERRAAMVVTHLQDGRDRLVLENDSVEGVLGAEIRKAFRTGKSVKVDISGEAVFLNVHVPAPHLVIIGAVHISQALALMAQTAGFSVRVIDPRTAFATTERFGGTELFAEWPEDVFQKYPLDSFTAVAAVTHDPKIDDTAIIEALNAQCFYVGALGSRKTHGKRIDRLRACGLDDAMLSRIKAPIGLDIAASSPQEIAVAILAEVIATLRNRGNEDR